MQSITENNVQKIELLLAHMILLLLCLGLMLLSTIFQSYLFVCLNVPVNSYGHVWTVSSPNHNIFPWQA